MTLNIPRRRWLARRSAARWLREVRKAIRARGLDAAREEVEAFQMDGVPGFNWYATAEGTGWLYATERLGLR